MNTITKDSWGAGFSLPAIEERVKTGAYAHLPDSVRVALLGQDVQALLLHIRILRADLAELRRKLAAQATP